MSNAGVGFVGVALAALGWGSNFIVVKGFDMKDGFAFQLWLCTGILFVGICTAFASEAQPGYAPGADGFGALNVTLSMLGVFGGAMWCVGNLCTVEIINCIGLGMGMAIWGGTSLIIAFILGRVRVCLGGECLDVNPLGSPACGIVGCIVSVASLALFSQVQPVLDNAPSATAPADAEGGHAAPLLDAPPVKLAETAAQRRVRGLAMAFFAGVCYGGQFLPGAIYAQFHNKDDSIIGEARFFFSQYVGIFLTSLAAYAAYCAVHAARKAPVPAVPLTAMLPAVVSGAIWAVAGAGAMFATDGLGYSVGYPLALNGAFLVNVLWASLYYREIQGRRNVMLFAAAVVLNVIGSVLVSLSK